MLHRHGMLDLIILFPLSLSLSLSKLFMGAPALELHVCDTNVQIDDKTTQLCFFFVYKYLPCLKVTLELLWTVWWVNGL